MCRYSVTHLQKNNSVTKLLVTVTLFRGKYKTIGTMGYSVNKLGKDGNFIFRIIEEGKDEEYIKCRDIASNRVKNNHYVMYEGWTDNYGDVILKYCPS